MRLINGVVTALVTNVNDPRKQGRVKITFRWLSKTHETDFIRIATPMAGNGRGAFFIPEVGDEVLVAFEGGDVRSPFVLGSLWNEKDPPPIEGIDTNVRRIKTVAGHIIELDDRGQSSHIRITTNSGHEVLLDDSPGNQKMEIVDKSGANSITIESQPPKITIANTQGDIHLSAPTGTLTIEATNVAIKGATVEIKSQGPLLLRGAVINLN